MDNIIKFPGKSLKTKETFTFADYEEEIMESVKNEADESAEFIWACVLMDMTSHDFELDRSSDEIKTASILVLESIRSLHYLTKGIEHPLQDISKELFEINLETE